MSSLNSDTHFIMFVPKADASELERIEEADEQLKKESWSKLKVKELEKVSGLSIYNTKPGYEFKTGYEVTQVQQIGTGAILVTYKSK